MQRDKPTVHIHLPKKSTKGILKKEDVLHNLLHYRLSNSPLPRLYRHRRFRVGSKSHSSSVSQRSNNALPRLYRWRLRVGSKSHSSSVSQRSNNALPRLYRWRLRVGSKSHSSSMSQHLKDNNRALPRLYR